MSQKSTKNLLKNRVGDIIKHSSIRTIVILAILFGCFSSTSAKVTHAQIWFPPPPSCHRDIRPIQWKPGAIAYYEFAYEYKVRLPGPPYRGKYPYAVYYVYFVQNMIYPWGLVPAGRAEKRCGTISAP